MSKTALKKSILFGYVEFDDCEQLGTGLAAGLFFAAVAYRSGKGQDHFLEQGC